MNLLTTATTERKGRGLLQKRRHTSAAGGAMFSSRDVVIIAATSRLGKERRESYGLIRPHLHAISGEVMHRSVVLDDMFHPVQSKRKRQKTDVFSCTRNLRQVQNGVFA